MYLQKCFNVIIFVFLLCGFSLSQSVYEQQYNNTITIVKYKDEGSYYYDKSNGNISIGYEEGSWSYSKETYRTVLEFDISEIESDARIDHA